MTADASFKCILYCINFSGSVLASMARNFEMHTGAPRHVTGAAMSASVCSAMMTSEPLL